jgi:glycosyltransferase involved in cell wall biosynthesis
MKDILDGTRSFDRYYEDLSASKADVTHFLTGQMIPNNVRGPAVVTVHDIMSLVPLAQSFVYDENAPYLEASLSYLKERPDIMIISDSASTKADLVNYMGINDERIKVVPLSCDKTQLYPERDSEILREMKIQEPYILFLAAFVKHKGIVDILKAFSAVKEKHKEIKLVLAGNINFVDDDVKKAIERHPNREDIVLPGFVSEQQKRVLMSMAEVFVFPSYYEGFGFPVLEAMSCGCPVITTNVSSLPEVGGDAALYCERGDVDTLSELMQYVLDSSTIREKLCRKSLQQADKFSWDNTALETERVYKKIVKG